MVDNASEQFLSFHVTGEEYAVSILQVKEIIEYTPVTRMPSSPASIRGVVNLRGQVVPVIDLAVRFALAETELTKRTCIVMVEVNWQGERIVVGLLVESVSQVIDLARTSIQPPPSFGTRARADFLQGMAEAAGKFVLILEIDRLLATIDLAEVNEAAAETALVPAVEPVPVAPAEAATP